MFINYTLQTLDGTVKAGKMNCEVHHTACQEAGVRAYPTVRFYRGSSDGGRQSTDGIDFRSLDKGEIIKKAEQWVPKRESSHDELWSGIVRMSIDTVVVLFIICLVNYSDEESYIIAMLGTKKFYSDLARYMTGIGKQIIWENLIDRQYL